MAMEKVLALQTVQVDQPSDDDESCCCSTISLAFCGGCNNGK
jgi:hypothetical protein